MKHSKKMTNYVPRYNHVIVEKIDKKEIASGLILPEKVHSERFVRLKVLHPGTSEDLHAGDLVWAEDMYEKLDAETGIIDSKFIHCIIRS